MHSVFVVQSENGKSRINDIQMLSQPLLSHRMLEESIARDLPHQRGIRANENANICNADCSALHEFCQNAKNAENKSGQNTSIVSQLARRSEIWAWQ